MRCKMLQDYIIRVTTTDGSIRAFAGRTTNTVNEAVAIHKTSPVVSAALGRLITITAIMGLTLKDETDLITVNIKGNGSLSGLTVTADNRGNVKGYPYVQNVDIPNKPNGKLDVSGALGDGTLTIIKDIGMKEPYVGQTHLISGEIAEDITYYFATSEQTPSSVGAGVLIDVDYTVKQAGGFLIQAMPLADEKVLEDLEQSLLKLESITSLLEQGKTPEDILDMTLDSYTVHETIEVKYYCNCGRDRVEKALISVGLEELNNILEQERSTSLHCHFCNKNYFFDENDLKKIIQSVQSK